ncbi:MAG: hypothetical protein COW00_17965 [Bdellovibrio sp. CG12_big_fil_rev_8_21_14_0_65_39_13]|nr:MAG: hypothetical protein COW78_06205 [Bdellovibrio sp. CG22_combo_CG10-13_8_21_14_all_39_27]PIQ57995.1 MAG: hypothetical protein COW00_17965 [Bdellovibrio sp. CG12_big_fil_rev_8_21_14_0_65_39_13]PIR32870.1 MAG: hypothetical protein COV37_17375 [Bdellovibrio sp. CG11_big_fil_rev_8_21_14_0_20_39_38]
MQEVIVEIKDLNYQIPYGKVIIDGLSLSISNGEFIGLLGVNGAGKTTLIDLLMGIRPHSAGVLKILGEGPMDSKREHSNQVVFLSQDISHNAKLTIQDQLNHLAWFYPNYSKEVEAKLLNLFKLDSKARIGSLSTGQRKRVQIIFGFAAKPKLLIVDEITAVLDPEARELFFELAHDFCLNEQGSIILATNIEDDLRDVVSKIIFLDKSHAELHPASDINHLFNLKSQT